MAQPEYVPSAPRDGSRASSRLPTPLSWRAQRPAELVSLGGQPSGDGFGTPGPDQGYALKLARAFSGRLALSPGEHEEDAVAGCLGVALRRASAYGRAPVVYDVEFAYALWGFLDAAPPELAQHRRPLFAACAHDYQAQRTIADLVPAGTLRLTPAEVRGRVGGGGWRDLLGLDAAGVS